MSGVPYWIGKARGKKVIIDKKIQTVFRDAYCVTDRHGVPNSDELVLETDAGNFNTSDHDWDFPDRSIFKRG